ncbi:MAG: LamG-like jellyroll fold domain-containing protein [Niabella sp.]
MGTFFKYTLLGLAAIIIFNACNKSVVEYDASKQVDADTVTRQKKALVIVIDGAVGDQYRTMALPNFKALEQNSIYSYDGLNFIDFGKVSLSRSWASIFTGVNADKHNVNQALATNNFAQYPSFITRLKQADNNFYVATVAASDSMSTNLFTTANEKYVYVNDDAAVNTKAKSLLQSTAADLTIVHFNTPFEAGVASSFTAASPSYNQASVNVDNYIKQEIDAIKARSNYVNEDWMISIVSSLGSNAASTSVPWNAFEDANHNTLCFFYSPKFQLKSYTKPSANTIIPYQGTSPQYWVNTTTANNQTATMETNETDFDLGSSGDYTIQCKIKRFTTTNSWYPGFVSKRASFTTTSPGWLFFLTAKTWGFNVSQGSGNRQVVNGTVIADQQWHTLTVVIKTEGAARNLYAYTDGVKASAVTNLGTWNITSPSPVNIGYMPGSINYDPAQMNITDIRFYNTALSDAEISSSYCTVDVPTGDPYYSNLVGFWPSLEVLDDAALGKKYLKDHSSHGRRLVVNNFVNAQFNDSQFGVCPPVSAAVYRTAPLAIDIASQIYSWFGVPASPVWDLDGKAWVPNYSNND